MHSSKFTLIQAWNGSVDLLGLHSAQPQRYPHLLESGAQGAHGRFDILFGFPGDSLILSGDGSLAGPCSEKSSGFLNSFQRWWESKQQPASSSHTVPFRGGWFMYLGYELAGEIEPRLALPEAGLDSPVPTAIATRFPAAIIHDNETGETLLMAEKEHHQCLEEMAEDIAAYSSANKSSLALPTLNWIKEDPEEHYLRGVEKTLRYIRDGDVFQVNLSREWQAEFDHPPQDEDLYAVLRQQNPGPFNALATWPWGAILSSSPERLVRVKGPHIETRPIAGTRPRSTQQSEDESLSNELMSHPKERAEHIMLIDLERNDLGRVCKPGTVKVNELMVLESYAHVHHIVSNVEGTLRKGVSPSQILAAVFPGGTITGCPKVRCMEIIAELEQQVRGPYTGSLGYINRDGDMDMNILIRTMVRVGKHLHLRAGAGIVADSDPHHELQETRAKAKGMLISLGLDNE